MSKSIDGIKALLSSTMEGKDLDNLIELFNQPDEVFKQIAPTFKENLANAFTTKEFRSTVLDTLTLTSDFDPEIERKGFEDFIQDIKEEEGLSDEKKDILVFLIEESVLHVLDLYENPREKIEVKVEKLYDDAQLPAYAHPLDAGADVFSIENVTLQPNETTAVGTGLRFAIPKGYEIQVRPRSGLSLKTGLRIANAPGTIDCSYRGELRIIFHNTSLVPYEIKKGDKIAQILIAPTPMMIFIEAAIDTNTDRGEGGFGSTDV